MGKATFRMVPLPVAHRIPIRIPLLLAGPRDRHGAAAHHAGGRRMAVHGLDRDAIVPGRHFAVIGVFVGGCGACDDDRVIPIFSPG
jgi:hypothetical protein